MRTEPAEFVSAKQLTLFQPRYNIAPSQPVSAVRSRKEGTSEAVELKWGLIPYWSKDARIAYRTINARAESVSEKPAFRDAFQRRRCLILADGYFEWQSAGGKKLPYYVRMADDRPFAFAGLWESWSGPREAPLPQRLETCTIVTTPSNELTSEVHDRMPAILKPDDYELWLDTEFEGTETLLTALRPYDSDAMAVHRVGTLVNKPDNDVPECIERVPETKWLF